MANVLDESGGVLWICPRDDRASARMVGGTAGCAVFLDEGTREPVRVIVKEPLTGLLDYTRQEVRESLYPRYCYHFWWATEEGETKLFRAVMLKMSMESLSPTGAGNPIGMVLTLDLSS